VSATGAQANGGGSFPALSGDGQWVAFVSNATNIVSTNGAFHIFVHNLKTGTTELVSVNAAGEQGNNGSVTSRVAISGDGRFVAFDSIATNLVPDDTNGQSDIFVRDRQSGTTKRVSVASDGTQANFASTWPAISGNGRFVAFLSVARNLVPDDTNNAEDVFVHDRQTGMTERISANRPNGVVLPFRPAISADGRFVAFDSLLADDVDNVPNLYLRDRQTGTTEVVGSGNSGTYIGPAISADGRFVAFGTGSLSIYDRQTKLTESLAAEGVNGIGNPAISADGRFVAFYGNSIPATGFPAQIFLYDRRTHTSEPVSVNSNSMAANDVSYFSSISADGRSVAFQSLATNLVSDDTNGGTDVFVRILPTPACAGDCNADTGVTVDELVKMVNIALGSADPSDCSAGDINGDHAITVDEIVAAVNNALQGCGM
jgi:Tol biopolymer transport system component